MTIGILTLFTGETSSIITIATMGALTMYALSTISLFVLRKKDANLERPFKVPFYPFFPAVALVISILALLALAYSYTTLFLIYVALVVTGYILFLFGTKRAKNFH
jgi:ethanolamine permease